MNYKDLETLGKKEVIELLVNLVNEMEQIGEDKKKEKSDSEMINDVYAGYSAALLTMANRTKARIAVKLNEE
jgi:hypothetical protein